MFQSMKQCRRSYGNAASPETLPQVLKRFRAPRDSAMSDDAGLATAILHSLNPAKNFLGGGLAEGERTHPVFLKGCYNDRVIWADE